MKRCLMAFVWVFLACAPVARAAAAADTEGGYAVVVSRQTHDDAEWAEVVTALVDKYGAEVIEYDNSVAEARDALAASFPRYTCFVATPAEARREFVVDVHRMTRKLDEDPYTDTMWGILTGYKPADALRIAQTTEPLTVRKAAAGTGIDLNLFDEGVWYSEGEKNAMFRKEPGGEATREHAPDDTTEALADTLSTYQPDLFVTSGHATERDWQIGYSYKNGQFRCKDGTLVGVSTDGTLHPIQSPNPKVYLAAGNCLMGRIVDDQSMALAWLGSGGVNQMVGYVVSTWYGYGGWGVNDYFLGQPGRFTLAESFYLNNVSLVHQLQSRFPDVAQVDFDNWEIETDPQLLNKLARQHRITEKDQLGLLWDRDTVAFYGDPAWQARLADRDLPWAQELTEKNGTYTFELTANDDATPGRPPAVVFPHRVTDVEVTEGQALSPVIADNFLLLPLTAPLKKGDTLRVVFKAKRVEWPDDWRT